MEKVGPVLEKLVDRAPVALVVLGVVLILAGATGGWSGGALEISETGWRIFVGTVGSVMSVGGGLLVWREVAGRANESPKRPYDACGIRLSQPEPGSEIGMQYDVSGVYERKPREDTVVQVFHAADGIDEYWPVIQTDVVFDTKEKTWRSRCRAGGEAGLMDVVVALVGPAGQALCAYYRKVGKETQQWPGIGALTPDIVECDRVTVVRRSLGTVNDTGPSDTEPADGDVLLEQVCLDYDVSPAERGWRITQSVPQFHPVEDGFVGRALRIDAGADYAMDWDVCAQAQAATRVTVTAKYEESSRVYVRVGLRSVVGGAELTGRWMLLQAGANPPRPLGSGEWEWVLSVAPAHRQGGWSVFEVDLVDAVSRSFGQRGWAFGRLEGFRIRGSVAIAEISAYR